VTSTDLDMAIAALPLTTPAERRQDLEGMRAALATCTATLYSPAFEPHDGPLDDALSAARRSTTRARQTHRWPQSLWTARSPATRNP
jgi:hypothetical protein